MSPLVAAPIAQLVYTAETWILGDSSLTLDATITVAISDIQVTLVDAVCSFTGKRVHYWQRTALAEWVGCHQHLLRRLQPMHGEPGYGLVMAAAWPNAGVAI